MKSDYKLNLALLAFFVILLLPAAAFGETPSVRNFSRSLYGGGAQNWAVAQDSLGRMYFGNRVGLLVADGSSWNFLRLPNFSTVRSVMIDESSGRIYVGGSEEFGYFDIANPLSGPVFRSLVATVDAPQADFTEVWNIHRGGRAIWFQSDFKILKWDGADRTEVIDIDDKITTSSVIGDKLYAGLLHKGLVYVSERRAHPVDGAGDLEGKRIVAILGDPRGGMLIVTAYDGLWRFDGAALTYCDGEVSDFLKHNQAFCATYDSRSGQYAFGTVAGGVVYVSGDISGRPQYVDITTGLQDNTVLSLGFDRDANLWLGLDNGLDYVICNSAVSRLPLPGGALGAGYASLVDGSRLLLGTNRGLYGFTYPLPPRFHTMSPQPLLKGQMWFVESVGGDVFAGGDGGLWVSRPGGQFVRVANVGGSWGMRPLPGRDGMVLVSTYEGFVVLRQESPGVWSFVNRVSGYTDTGGRFVIGDGLVVWIAHWMKGMYRMTLSPDLTHFDSVKLLTSDDGLPTDRNNLVSEVKGRAVISTEGGFYTYNDTSGKFTPDSSLNSVFGPRLSARIYTAPDGVLWSVSPDNVWTARADAGGNLRLDTVTYQPLAESLIPGFDHFYFAGKSKAIVSGQEGFFEVNLDGRRHATSAPGLFISRVYAGSDSLVYNAPFASSPQEERLTVGYDMNSLRFDAAMPEYRADKAVKYSFMLENYDADWSAWSTTRSKEYTRLSEGTYTLRVRARDGYSGLYGETSFEFTVRPPWYRSVVAKIFYLLVIIGLIWFAIQTVKNASQRSTREMAERKEAEMTRMRRKNDEEAMRKDYEIAHLKSQQLEHDIKHKSEELSNITMNLIRKNEILLDIDGKIAKLRESMGPDVDSTSEGKQLNRIHRLIQDNISHDDDWRAFTRNFDVVYENYTKRLVEAHPELSQSDLRICCYLKMGLSSKDIAHLFNISYRSVEMTRYRLRKKLGLTRETNLVDYLQKF